MVWAAEAACIFGFRSVDPADGVHKRCSRMKPSLNPFTSLKLFSLLLVSGRGESRFWVQAAPMSLIIHAQESTRRS